MSSRMVATRITDDVYSKILAKCSGLGCSPYDYLRMLIETDMKEEKEIERTDEKGIKIVG